MQKTWFAARTIALALFVAISAGIFAPGGAFAELKSKAEIDAGVKDTLHKFYKEFPGGRDLVAKAAGTLVFPHITKGGFIVGGEYGEGALVVGGKTAGYYNSASASIGFQAGLQSRSQLIIFMTEKALKEFRDVDGWQAGVDASVTLIDQGASGKLNTDTIKQPVIGVVFGAKGLMGGISLDGTKISKIH
ncbi:MAG: hypothetical protein LPL00_03065 [Alphaproteobacteria bacterium]|nr:hypothetical protein [Alphaproteobacteria bacterium]MDX5368422.1 hypothetical protein [Alphaproteobacteria bacterium]MDX5463217.1 hypothetical protein [Alphaproteobacteria bacterium]